APRRIEGLSRRRWNALAGALGPRDGRFASVGQLLNALDLPGYDQRVGRRKRVKPSRGRLRSTLAVATLLIGLIAVGAGIGRFGPERMPAMSEISSWLATA